MALKLIRKNNQTEVTAYEDAVIFHSAKGHVSQTTRGGVFEGIYEEFGYILDNVSKKFILKSGMGMLYGRQFELPQNERFEIQLSGSTTLKEILVYAEIKITTTAETLSIKSKEGTPTVSDVANTNIVKSKTGTATMPLYKLVWQNNNVTSVVKLFHVYTPGESISTRSIGPNGTINGRKVSNLVYSDRDMVTNAKEATYASVASSIGSGATNINKINDNLELTERKAKLAYVQVVNISQTLAKNASASIAMPAVVGKVRMIDVLLNVSDSSVGMIGPYRDMLTAEVYTEGKKVYFKQWKGPLPGGNTDSYQVAFATYDEGAGGKVLEVSMTATAITLKNLDTEQKTYTGYFMFIITGN